jgi:mono/diheme cytochrome c family protein
VFADFTPRKIARIGDLPPMIDYNNNSVDFAGLQTLEEKIATLQPPPWPSNLFGLDTALAAKGQALFDQNCGRCHGENRSPSGTWTTPVQPVGTDPKMAINAARTSDPGIYAGALLVRPVTPPTFSNPADTRDILAASVVKIMLAEAASAAVTPERRAQSGVWRAIEKDLSKLLPSEQFTAVMKSTPDAMPEVTSLITVQLNNAFTATALATTAAAAAYEARVLHGIWATSPYLHNGSVPNLWELMKPPKDRVTAFNVGCRRFDPKNVGFVSDDPSCKTGTFTVDPNNANGNGNGGHDFGTALSDDDRWAIIEYLKQY